MNQDVFPCSKSSGFVRFYVVPTRFPDRAGAGRALAGMLDDYAGRDDITVLALPRGGVPVGLEIARHLRAPLDVMIVRKLGAPWQPELAMGAIAGGGFRAMNEDVVAVSRITEYELNNVIQQELRELERRERFYRGGRPAADLKGRIVVLVDDGIATGATMRVAIQAVRHAGPSRVVIATPVAAAATLDELRGEADEAIAALIPGDLHSIGEWYDDFSQLSDEEVIAMLASQ
jgi:putative phosphoribosyl transferase